MTPDLVLDVARSQLGYTEGLNNRSKFGEWYADQVRDPSFAAAPWCDEFVSWCAHLAGAGSIVGRFAYTPSHAQWFANRGLWGQKPRKGAVVFFDWSGSKSIPAIDHVGFVEAVQADGSIVTIEGNTGSPGAVRRRVRRAGIAGFGYPTYNQENDMPLSKADLEQIRAIVWDSDKALAPAGTDPKNKTWRPVNIARETYTSLQQVKAAVAQLATASPDIDETAIVEGVLAGLTPEAIAAAVVGALPAELAHQVVDEIASRLAPTT